MLPRPHPLPNMWFGKASPQPGEKAQRDVGVVVPGKQHLVWV